MECVCVCSTIPKKNTLNCGFKCVDPIQCLHVPGKTPHARTDLLAGKVAKKTDCCGLSDALLNCNMICLQNGPPIVLRKSMEISKMAASTTKFSDSLQMWQGCILCQSNQDSPTGKAHGFFYILWQGSWVPSYQFDCDQKWHQSVLRTQDVHISIFSRLDMGISMGWISDLPSRNLPHAAASGNSGPLPFQTLNQCCQYLVLVPTRNQTNW